MSDNFTIPAVEREISVGVFFSGIGIWELVARRHGCKIKFSIEINAGLHDAIRESGQPEKILGDINHVTVDDLERVDIICLGTSCGGVSMKAGRHRQGLNHKETRLWIQSIKLIKEYINKFGHHPILLIENCTGIRFAINNHGKISVVCDEDGGGTTDGGVEETAEDNEEEDNEDSNDEDDSLFLDLDGVSVLDFVYKELGITLGYNSIAHTTLHGEHYCFQGRDRIFVVAIKDGPAAAVAGLFRGNECEGECILESADGKTKCFFCSVNEGDPLSKCMFCDIAEARNAILRAVMQTYTSGTRTAMFVPYLLRPEGCAAVLEVLIPMLAMLSGIPLEVIQRVHGVTAQKLALANTMLPAEADDILTPVLHYLIEPGHYEMRSWVKAAPWEPESVAFQLPISTTPLNMNQVVSPIPNGQIYADPTALATPILAGQQMAQSRSQRISRAHQAIPVPLSVRRKTPMHGYVHTSGLFRGRFGFNGRLGVIGKKPFATGNVIEFTTQKLEESGLTLDDCYGLILPQEIDTWLKRLAVNQVYPEELLRTMLSMGDQLNPGVFDQSLRLPLTLGIVDLKLDGIKAKLPFLVGISKDSASSSHRLVSIFPRSSDTMVFSVPTASVLPLTRDSLLKLIENNRQLHSENNPNLILDGNIKNAPGPGRMTIFDIQAAMMKALGKSCGRCRGCMANKDHGNETVSRCLLLLASLTPTLGGLLACCGGRAVGSEFDIILPLNGRTTKYRATVCEFDYYNMIHTLVLRDPTTSTCTTISMCLWGQYDISNISNPSTWYSNKQKAIKAYNEAESSLGKRPFGDSDHEIDCGDLNMLLQANIRGRLGLDKRSRVSTKDNFEAAAAATDDIVKILKLKLKPFIEQNKIGPRGERADYFLMRNLVGLCRILHQHKEEYAGDLDILSDEMCEFLHGTFVKLYDNCTKTWRKQTPSAPKRSIGGPSKKILKYKEYIMMSEEELAEHAATFCSSLDK